MADKGPTEAQQGPVQAKLVRPKVFRVVMAPIPERKILKNKHIKMPIEQEHEQEEDSDPQSGEEDGESSEEGSVNRKGQEEQLIKALRRMGIKAPKHFDPKRDKNFETWLERTEFHLAVNHCQEEDKTSSLYSSST